MAAAYGQSHRSGFVSEQYGQILPYEDSAPYHDLPHSYGMVFFISALP
ncbi:MAG: hypothetical protein H7A41_02580 [Chlamydiales bacterium]|nr:hypothetical protein [Chlamydiia bacterium]MCP5504020.1 hypothetical protein [Chlamydiales bacterium]